MTTFMSLYYIITSIEGTLTTRLHLLVVVEFQGVLPVPNGVAPHACGEQIQWAVVVGFCQWVNAKWMFIMDARCWLAYGYCRCKNKHKETIA